MAEAERKSETAPEWWSANGERDDARMAAANLRWFLRDARLLANRARYGIEEAIELLEDHANARG